MWAPCSSHENRPSSESGELCRSLIQRWSHQLTEQTSGSPHWPEASAQLGGFTWTCFLTASLSWHGVWSGGKVTRGLIPESGCARPRKHFRAAALVGHGAASTFPSGRAGPGQRWWCQFKHPHFNHSVDSIDSALT